MLSYAEQLDSEARAAVAAAADAAARSNACRERQAMQQQAHQERCALVQRAFATPCPRCGGRLTCTEHLICTEPELAGDAVALWEFCNRHVFPFCLRCKYIPFAAVVPPPAAPDGG